MLPFNVFSAVREPRSNEDPFILAHDRCIFRCQILVCQRKRVNGSEAEGLARRNDFRAFSQEETDEDEEQDNRDKEKSC